MTSSVPFTLLPGKKEVVLNDVLSMPDAGGFLWTPTMLMQMNCRGYAIAQHMQPEPGKYSSGPVLEATTFMQPEHPYYANHPGRFFYVKEAGQPLFSLPYEPVRTLPERFEFAQGEDYLRWRVEQSGLRFDIKLRLLNGHAVEHWQMKVSNATRQARDITLYPCFSIGYQSWMYQGADFDPQLNAVVATSITPYQKPDDYARISQLKDLTFLLSSQAVDSWTTRLSGFEGMGGMHNPDAVQQPELPQQVAKYEVPVAAMQHAVAISPGQSVSLNWWFGAVKNREDIAELTANLADRVGETATQDKDSLAAVRDACMAIDTPDPAFDDFINHWLPRQLRYLGQTNRLSTDPQTRNYLQDNMGMIYLSPSVASQALLKALSQQSHNGAMPDGILLHEQATLKYINQVPHADHNVWLALFVSTFIRETGQTDLLDEVCPYADITEKASVFEHVQQAMKHLLENLDHRGLSLIKQGDWCDPMDRVGKDGKGVSAWLSMASAYAFRLWAEVCEQYGKASHADYWLAQVDALNKAVNQHLWDGQWYARGITDEGTAFGVKNDEEGRIYLNPQSWSMLAGTADANQVSSLLEQIDRQLDTPFGPMMLAPAYTAFREDVGRLTQKYPGVAENGSTYNHAVAFYIYSLYLVREPNRAFGLLKKMLVDGTNAQTKGQLPTFIPNYFRGAYHQHREHAGRSSHLFNTGTVTWFYLCVIEELFGLKGTPQGLKVCPQLPDHWQTARVSRTFRGVTYEVTYQRTEDVSEQVVEVIAGEKMAADVILGQRHFPCLVTVKLPAVPS